MQVFRNRARRGHHDHRTDVTTNGTRIITANNGRAHSVVVPATHVSSRHGHRVHRGTTVVAANIPSGHSHGTHVARSRDQRRYYRDDPSTFHGLWNKVLGILTGNRRRRRLGDREMRKARERRDALRTARGIQRVRGTGHIAKLRKFGDRPRRHRRNQREPVIIPDSGRRQGGAPWLHHKHRTLPPYHGMHHRIIGFFTRRRERRAMGEAMAAAAEEERRRERIRRREEMKDLGRQYRERRRR